MFSRKAVRPLLLLLLLCSTLAMGATITLFQAVSDNNDIRVTWEVASESGVQSYDLYRRTDTETAFSRLTTVAPGGQARYQYLDTDAYQNAQSSGTFTYRLTVRTPTGEQNYTSTLGQTPSAMQRSWGSIKSMFL